MSNIATEGVIIVRDGEIKLRIPAVALDLRGNQIWHRQTGCPVINTEAAGADLPTIKALLQKNKISEVSAKYSHAIHILGENKGVWIGTEKDWYALPAQIAEREQALANTCKCEQCKAHVDGRTAYKQNERTCHNGALITVVAYYCEACRETLSQVGVGEYTALQQRAAK